MVVPYPEPTDKWDQRFLALARHFAAWSKDPSTQVGAVIVDKRRRILSSGYNGFPAGIPDVALEDRDHKYPRIVHAEMNALLFATAPLVGATLYVWPMPPCSHCAGPIIQAGIQRIVSPPAVERWEESCSIARDMFGWVGIRIEEMEL